MIELGTIFVIVGLLIAVFVKLRSHFQCCSALDKLSEGVEPDLLTPTELESLNYHFPGWRKYLTKGKTNA